MYYMPYLIVGVVLEHHAFNHASANKGGNSKPYYQWKYFELTPIILVLG